MLKDIVKDTVLLSRPCKTVNKNNREAALEVAKDLCDTAAFYADSKNCVGLAANQIGSDLRVIVVKIGDSFIPFINPTILEHSKAVVLSEEGCLSLEGIRTVHRFTSVTILFSDIKGKVKKQTFNGFNGFVFQHEIDHLNGKLI